MRSYSSRTVPAGGEHGHAGLESVLGGQLLLSRQLTFASQQIRLYHYRDRDRYEVDALLESTAGEIVACEVKAAETVRSEDFRGIQRIQRQVGDQLIAGIVLYAGQSPLSFGERLRPWPISTLWTQAPTG